MYIPKHFEGDEAQGREIMRAHSWALLTTADESGVPVCTHLVLQWEDDGSPHGSLIGHMARNNDQWKLFARGVPSLALFWGPHAYGRPQVIEATPAVLMVLTKLAAQYEGSGAESWGLGRLPPGNAAEQSRSIVAFRMPLERVETKLKLSQNRDLEDRHRVIARLEASDSQDSRATAKWMKRVLPG